MALLASAIQRARRAHPLITLGIVMGMLLAGLLALPFLVRTHPPGSPRSVTIVGPVGHS